MPIRFDRRQFVAALGGAAAWPLAARTQQPDRMRRIGVLMAASANDPEYQASLKAFRESLQKLGWVEGRNSSFDIRWATFDAISIERLAKELVASTPDVVLSQSTFTTAAMLTQTRSIPIVFANASDPVGSGFVSSLPRPGGNVTGFLNVEGSLGGKWLELLKQIAPPISKVAFLFEPTTSPFYDIFLNSFEEAARSLGVEAITAPVHDPSDLEPAIAALAPESNGGLIVMPGVFVNVNREQVITLAARYKIPALYPFRNFTEIGGLLSYGNDPLDQYRRAASYVDRILRGAKPSELPVQAPVKFELVINLKAAKSLGIGIPEALLLRADEVIE
jgi:putative ABC transport system substrate-binding protein